MIRNVSIGLLASVLAVAGCRHQDRDDPGAGVVTMRSGTQGASAPLGAGDVRITTVDGSIDLALIGDTISSGLSQATLAKAARETDSSTVQGTGFGASIEKMVKGTVQSAIGTRAGFPVSAVKDVSYTNGRIDFAWAGPPRKIFDHTSVNHKPLLASFSAEDSQRFVDAVRSRIGQGLAR